MNVPAEVNVRENAAPGFMLPESQMPLGEPGKAPPVPEVEVWVITPAFVQRTLSPMLMVIVPGLMKNSASDTLWTAPPGGAAVVVGGGGAVVAGGGGAVVVVDGGGVVVVAGGAVVGGGGGTVVARGGAAVVVVGGGGVVMVGAGGVVAVKAGTVVVDGKGGAVVVALVVVMLVVVVPSVVVLVVVVLVVMVTAGSSVVVGGTVAGGWDVVDAVEPHPAANRATTSASINDPVRRFIRLPARSMGVSDPPSSSNSLPQVCTEQAVIRFTKQCQGSTRTSKDTPAIPGYGTGSYSALVTSLRRPSRTPDRAGQVSLSTATKFRLPLSRTWISYVPPRSGWGQREPACIIRKTFVP